MIILNGKKLKRWAAYRTYKMFQRIEYDAMVPGQRYKIGETSGVFIKICSRINGVWFLQFRGLEKKEPNKTTYLSHHCEFYQFIPQMETRTVNLIVRKLIGDDNFEW